MRDPAATLVAIKPPESVRAPDAVRAQILATEHWGLLATRTMVWNEVFSRAGMFFTVLSAAVVALALIGQGTGFGPGFRVAALLLLPVVLAVGLGTFARLKEANGDDTWLVIGMNRLRHAYVEIAPELAPYFVSGLHDDEAGVMRSLGPGDRLRLGRILASTPALVAAVEAALAGVVAALLGQALGGRSAVQVAVGVAAAVATAGALGMMAHREIARFRREHRPRFPS